MPKSKRDRSIKFITDRVRLYNAKSRRQMNLFKKSWELSQLCDLNITVLVYDKKKNNLSEYNTN